MKQYIKAWIKSLFSSVICQSNEEADKVKERFENLKGGYGEIDHDQLLEEKGVFMDDIRFENGWLRQTERAKERWLRTKEAQDMFQMAKEIVEKSQARRR